jgi:large subunit ribosomal protein L31
VKEKTHPEMHEVTITCACGAQYPTKSTKKSVSVEICSACHPFFTGKQKLLDTAGRVDRFRRKYKNYQANLGK